MSTLEPRTLRIPKLALVVLVGSSGSGKSTFARKHFLPTEILSSDAFRAMLTDDETNQAISSDAFALLHQVAGQRLALGKLTVIDATNVQQDARQPLLALARNHHCFAVAIVLNLPEKLCHERNAQRTNRSFGAHVVKNHVAALKRSLKHLEKEGFRHVHVLNSPEEIESVVIERQPLWTDRSHEHGPFDFIGDVHGCADELELLLEKLGYEKTTHEINEPGWTNVNYAHPAGRKAVFVGDLVDRGPRVLDTLRIVRNMLLTKNALCVPGNHDMKLVRKLSGSNTKISHGLAATMAEIDALAEDVREPFTRSLVQFLDSLVSHYVLDDGKIVVAHAGMKAEYQGRSSGKVRSFALFGETTGETDEFGLPVRLNWAADYRGSAMVVYGHTPVPEAEWLNRTVDIDTGCVFGGKLTALRYPELEFVSIPAAKTYAEPAKPFLTSATIAQHNHDDVLDLADVMGKRVIATKLRGNVTIREEHAAAALEVMSRFAANPKWLIYLPPTLSPSETTSEHGLLEHPQEAFAYYRKQGVSQVLCEEKHMGSRAVVIVCQDEAAAQRRFGIGENELGIVLTRTGRRFFNDSVLEGAFLDRVRSALTKANIWEQFDTSWVCLDCELLPWSAKAQELLKSQYAAVGAAGRAALPSALESLTLAGPRLSGQERAALDAIRLETQAKWEHLNQFVTAYRQYCWPVNRLTDLKLAPFHFLATEGQVHTNRTHTRHLATLAAICQHDTELLRVTRSTLVDTANPASVDAGIAWWSELTAQGGEGMVVKPLDFIVTGEKANGRVTVQPAIKCRGREYLRIIYGPDYTLDANLTRLRKRGLGHKRALALSEFALGIEGLERFVRREPLRTVHECVFGVLALESEPLDPRL